MNTDSLYKEETHWVEINEAVDVGEQLGQGKKEYASFLAPQVK